MWVVVLFDLPVDTPQARREYAWFRKKLLKAGFMRMQYSVYARPCASEEAAQSHTQRVGENLPPDGQVRVLWLTDKQFERQRIFDGKRRRLAEQPPKQLEFF